MYVTFLHEYIKGGGIGEPQFILSSEGLLWHILSVQNFDPKETSSQVIVQSSPLTNWVVWGGGGHEG